MVGISCAHHDLNYNSPAQKKINNFKEFEVLGNIHNELLYVGGLCYRDNFSRSISLADSILFSEIHQQQKLAVNNLSLTDRNKNILTTSLDEYVKFYDTDCVYKELNDYFDNSKQSNYLKTLKDLKIITLEDKRLVELLICAVNCNKSDGDQESLKRKIDDLCQQWIFYFEGKTEKEGEFSGQILSIAKSSIEWWEDNKIETRALPAWVGADAAGAIIGAGHNALNQYIARGNVDLQEVGLHALGGAVIASTGVVKAFGGWISKMF